MTIQEKLSKAETLIREFKELRKMQKEYFRYRDQRTLEKCKIQEKKVDQMLEEYDKPQTLF